MKRIIAHWTGGNYRASGTDKKHYHFIFEGDGNCVKGNHDISDNESTADRNYAAHTLGCNTGSIGLSMACMYNAVENGEYGSYPMTEAQFNALVKKTAVLCALYNIKVTPQTVLSHAEVEKNLGIKQRGKWDFTVLPFKIGPSGATQCGNYYRKCVLKSISDKANSDKTPKFLDNALDDADKPLLKSTTIATAALGGTTGVGGIIASTFDAIDNPFVQVFLISIIAGSAFWIIRERKRKAKAARLQKENIRYEKGKRHATYIL